MAENNVNIISLGWGVQSFTIAAMVALDELPPVHAALHADTTHERSDTYEFSTEMTPWLEGRGVRVVNVSDSEQAALVTTELTDIPAFTSDGFRRGMLRRQCTGRWKIQPMRVWISAELRRLGVKKLNGVVTQWLGISIDEAERMKRSDVKYIVNRWPLVEKRMTRLDCERWLRSHGLPIPPKSACVFCPYHSVAGWRSLNPDDFKKAVSVDEAIRNVRPPYSLFIHPSRVPLSQVDLRSPEERGQLSIFPLSDECSGICFV